MVTTKTMSVLDWEIPIESELLAFFWEIQIESEFPNATCGWLDEKHSTSILSWCTMPK